MNRKDKSLGGVEAWRRQGLLGTWAGGGGSSGSSRNNRRKDKKRQRERGRKKKGEEVRDKNQAF